MRASWRAALALGLLAGFVVLLGAAQKTPCIERGWVTMAQDLRQGCYSDVPLLYVARGLDADQPLTRYDDSQPPMEYPVLTIALARAEAKVAHALVGAPHANSRTPTFIDNIAGDEQLQREATVMYLVNLAVMAAIAAAITVVLARTWGKRAAVIFAVSPHLLLSAGVNWDLLAVLGLVGSLAAWQRRRAATGGVLLAAGTAAKLFPAVAAGGFVLDTLRERGWRGALRDRRLWVTGVVAAAVWAALNVPMALAAPNSWGTFYSLSRHRPSDIGTPLYLFTLLGHPLSVGVTNLASTAVLLLAVAAVAVLALRARAAPDVVEVTLLLLVAFTLAGKVYSPQFTLWLLPLVAICVRRTTVVVLWQATELLYWLTTMWLWMPAGWSPWFGVLVLVLKLSGTAVLAGQVGWQIWRRRPYDPAHERGAGVRALHLG